MVDAGAEELLRMRDELLGQISREELEMLEEQEDSEEEEVRGVLEGGGEVGGGKEQKDSEVLRDMDQSRAEFVII